MTRNRISKTKSEQKDPAADRDLYSGLIRLHVLHHAAEGPIFGLGMVEELACHGYRISPGKKVAAQDDLHGGTGPLSGRKRVTQRKNCVYNVRY